ncbi:trigger factor [Yeguia hominis]|uniref:Trigger factor n=1 Tax=Yeguia hominis TaxID=2763662 RepID=A0A926D8Q2_9FIRM|nr:trigger factor [Yeguia hominis]MBC8532455.1 trigger factor [Yeguia hominis]
MSLKASNKVDTNRWELEVEVGAEQFEDAIARVFKREAKKIQIPGFRKGKAPRAFVEKYYGEQVFYEDAVNLLVPGAFEEAIKEAGLDAIQDDADLEIVSIGKEGFTFKGKVTTKPEVSIADYKGIEVKKPKVDVTEEDVDKEVEKVRERNSRMITVEDRAAQLQDTAVIDFEGFVDGKEFEGGKGENFSLSLGSGQFIPGFEDQVVGHHTGDTFDVTVTFPEDYHAEDLKGKEAVFKVTVHEIKAKELPEFDDEFVKDVSDFDTIADYREDLKKKLTESREKAADDEVENALIDALIEKLQADIPEAMFKNQAEESVREFEYRLRSQGIDFDMYAKYTGMDRDAIRASVRPQAERQVKIRLALEKIAELEDLKPTEEELAAQYEKMAKAYEMEADKIKAFIPEEDVAKDLSVEKAIAFVRDNAKIEIFE